MHLYCSNCGDSFDHDAENDAAAAGEPCRTADGRATEQHQRRGRDDIGALLHELTR